MFDSLIDNVNADKWQEVDMSSKVESEWAEFQVNSRHSKQVNDTTVAFQVAPQSGDGEAQTVEIKDCLPKKNPLKEIHIVELKIVDKEIVGVDLNGDVIVRK